MKTKLNIAMRAKVGVVYAQTLEELRVERAIVEVSEALAYAEVLRWTSTKGLVPVGEDRVDEQTRDPSTAIKVLMARTGRVVGIFVDLTSWLGDPLTLRTMKDAHRAIPSLEKDNAKQIVVVDVAPPPATLTGITVLEWPLPDRAVMESVLESFMSFSSVEAKKEVAANDNRNRIVSAMLGLTAEDAASALSRSLAETGRFDVQLIAKEKERVVRGSGLEWYEPDPAGFDSIGGLDVLKASLTERKKALSAAAREYGLPAPKGVVLTGIPGCAKSLTAKCVSAAWGLPLLKLDVGSMFSKFVGDSEARLRQALKTAETVAPCVLWLDEIEKAFGGGGGESDGGTSMRVFGYFLTWMQERKAGVYIIATSNDIQKILATNPEFLRAGRWDDVWFVDLPTAAERATICDVMKKRYKNTTAVASPKVAAVTDGYTGAEIEQAFIDAMYVAFSDGERKVKTEDVVAASERRVPLSVVAKDKITSLREWAKGRARNASTEGKKTSAAGRAIE